MLSEQKEVTIEIEVEGNTTLDFAGFVGKTCLKEAERIRALLAARGLRIEDTNLKFKPEYELGQLVESQTQAQTPQTQTHTR